MSKTELFLTKDLFAFSAEMLLFLFVTILFYNLTAIILLQHTYSNKIKLHQQRFQ